MTVERNFLFGLTALRSGLIDPAQLAEAGTEWMAYPDRSLADVLTEKGWLSASDRSTLEDRVLHEIEEPTTAPGEEAHGTGPSTILYTPETTHPQNGLSGESTQESISATSLLRRTGREGGTGEETGFGPRYEVIDLHATGGIGRVWRVFDRILLREVALKELRPDRDRNGFDERRFLEEARITAGLDHPNIVPAYDLAEWGVRPFYTMRFIQGDRTLREAARQLHRTAKTKPAASQDEEPMDLRRLLDHFLAVCHGIDYAHSRGVIHRDLKGQNVVLGSFGETFVVDWGLARRLGAAEDPLARPAEGFHPNSDTTMTVDGFPIGTLSYMPPEQAMGDGKRIGPRSDVFGLGALLYLILTGKPPYEGGDSTAVLGRALVADVKPPSTIAADVPPALEAICLRAVAKEPDDRYPSARELAEDVRRWLDDEPVSVLPETVRERLGRWERKHPARMAAVGAILATAVVGLSIGVWQLNIASEKIQQANFLAQHAIQIDSQDLADSVTALRGTVEILQRDLPTVRDEAADRVRLRVAETVTIHYRSLADRHRDNPKLQANLAEGLREAAKVYQLMYRLDESESVYRQAIDVVNTIPRTMEGVNPSEDLGIELRLALAEVIALKGDPAPAMAIVKEALNQASQRSRNLPNSPPASRTLGRALSLLADLAYQNGGLADSAALFAESRKKFQGIATSPRTLWNDTLCETLAVMGQGCAMAHDPASKQAAISSLQEAEALAHKLLTLEPGHNDADYVLACIQMELAAAVGPGEASRRALEAAHETFSKLASTRPDVLDYRLQLAMAGSRLASETGDPAMRAQAYAMANRLVDEAPAACRVYEVRSAIAVDLAEQAIRDQDPEHARQWAEVARGDLAVLNARNPRHPDDRRTRETLSTIMAKLDRPASP